MIVIAIGANLPADGFATALETCRAAVDRLGREPGVAVVAISRWYESEPVPPSGQPWYVNGVVLVETTLDPAALLDRLHGIEAAFGRVRVVRNEARPLDLDLIDYDGMVRDGRGGGPVLPHPRARERAFVLLPLADVAPDWRDPVGGREVVELIAALPADGPAIRPIPDA
jgi:2-amino-4-hydroxy-6-hydroxymethyldihydropteridine diphosphokinase